MGAPLRQALCPLGGACRYPQAQLPAGGLLCLRREVWQRLAQRAAWPRSQGRLAEGRPRSAAPAGVGEQSFAARAAEGLEGVELAHQGWVGPAQVNRGW